jgi:small-conductance mechanosensitive channel/CRP-like cAMP-binding protein
MNYWHEVEAAAGLGIRYHWAIVGCLIATLVLAVLAPASHGRLRAAGLMIVLSFLGMLVCGYMRYEDLAATSAGYRYVHFVSQLIFILALVNLVGVLLFRVLLPPIHLSPPPILRDALFGLAYIIAALTLLSHHGMDVGGIIATSAVVTAVIGFSLQDTLGNVMGGVALQMERSIATGDWVRVGDVEGLVREIRWRQTSIETRNWDTVVIPNSVLMKSQVTVLGRREGQPRQHRMWVDFYVDYRHAPGEVIEVVERALRSEETPNVSTNPPPDCVLFKFLDSYGHYSVRYWLTDLAKDDPTSSEVRSRVFVALQRAGISLSIPAQSVFMTIEGRTRKEQKHQEELHRRVAALEGVKILAPLNDEERAHLAERLTVAPFRKGEVITRQGNQSHYLYILTQGDAAVHVERDGETREVGVLHTGDVFGEMGLMTGAPRSSTVIALTDVVCYRLDKTSVGEILQHRPKIADAISHLLAQRKAELDKILDGLGKHSPQSHPPTSQNELLHRIKSFFTLDAP